MEAAKEMSASILCVETDLDNIVSLLLVDIIELLTPPLAKKI